MNLNSLLDGIRRREEASIKVLVNQHQEKVFNIVLNLVQNKEDAEELVQDVFVEAIESAPSFRGEASISTWIYRIAVNRSLDFIRSKKRKKRFAFLSSLWTDANTLKIDVPDFVHPGVQLEQKEDAAFFYRALSQLPENQKTALTLSKLEDMSQRQISEVMKLSESAVESLVNRAKQNLKKNLEKYFRESEGK